MNHQGPDWKDGDCCFLCRTQFTLVARKHHCRNCGNIFCAKCSSQYMPLPKLNLDKNVRVCDTCYNKLSSSNGGPKSSSKPQTNASSSASVSASASASASAPSEQDLKEEDDFQLALALSLSETTTRIKFPEIQPIQPVQPPSQPIENAYPTLDKQVLDIKQVVDVKQTVDRKSAPEPQTTPESQNIPNTQARDSQLMRFVNEAHSAAELFINRINSNKARNRYIANDSAIQNLFFNLTEMHTELLEKIKLHDHERDNFERIQDKLSQISDARAALDALREEHQQKVKEDAQELERQRRSQLAHKLEIMREKKAQMIQFQREVAMERIQMSDNNPGNKIPQHLQSAQQQLSHHQQHQPIQSQQQPQIQVQQPPQVQTQPQQPPQLPLDHQQQLQQQQPQFQHQQYQQPDHQVPHQYGYQHPYPSYPVEQQPTHVKEPEVVDDLIDLSTRPSHAAFVARINRFVSIYVI